MNLFLNNFTQIEFFINMVNKLSSLVSVDSYRLFEQPNIECRSTPMTSAP